MNRKIIINSVFIFICFMPESFSQKASFTGLGDLPGGVFSSSAKGVSDDGNLIIGYGTTSLGEEASRWTEEKGMLSLGNLPHNSFEKSWANSISADGKVIIGYGDPVGQGWNTYKGFVWTSSEGMQEIGTLDTSSRSMALCVSGDGKIIAGDGGPAAFKWTRNYATERLGVLTPRTHSRVVDMSTDGKVMIGQSYSLPQWNDEDGFIMSEDGIMQSMFSLTGGKYCMVLAVSPDGSVVAGTTNSGSSFPAFSWTKEKGFVTLGHLQGRNTTHPGDMTPYGKIIVGGSFSGPDSGDAFIWDSINGIRNLQNVLEKEYGLDLTGWKLQNASGITPDGNLIVGDAINPMGQKEGFRVILDTTAWRAKKETINIDFTSKNWKTLGSEIKEFDSKLTTYIPKDTGIGYLDSMYFQNGIIECDLYSPSDKAYLGIVFRITSLSNFEFIYFQPHTSGKWDAVQYDPIFNSSATWQLYNGTAYQAVANIPVREWFHVKIQIIGDSAKVYLGNNPKHILSVKLKHDYSSGFIGVCSYHPAYFANLKVTKLDTVTSFKPEPAIASQKPYISNWQISEPYDNYDFTIEKPFLNDSIVSKWQNINTEENYLVNLNRHFSFSKSKNTVLAKVIIDSKKPQKKKLYFGFSDKIRIFLNAENIFTGDNSFHESEKLEDRGYVLDKHQIIELPLIKGENELILEITEKQFGWGFITQLENLKGVEIINQ